MADSQIERLIELVDKAKEEYVSDVTDHTKIVKERKIGNETVGFGKSFG